MAEKKAKLWFDKDLATLLAEKIQLNYKRFDSKSFISAVDEGVGELELKARVELIADNLRINLPKDYPKALSIIEQSLGEENPNETGMFSEFYWAMPFATFIEKYGLDHLDESLNAIAEVTKRNTGEYAIRPYLEQHSKKTFKQIHKWSKAKNFHLRRLASEGSRPRLPWARKLNIVIEQPELSLSILETLKDDPIKYVQKSVANHLNDMLKDNYDIAMQTLKDWQKDSTDLPDRQWIIKHALRQQRKKENPDALALLAKMQKT